MKTLAIGRICQDEFFLVRRAKDRIASTKLTADYIGRQFGGSVFSEAKLLCEAGVETTLLVGMAEGDAQFGDMPLHIKTVNTSATPRSLVYLKEEYKLDRIYSVEEREGEQIAPTPELLEQIEQEAPARLLYDLRQTALMKAVLDRLHSRVELTVLDPGSTVFYTEDESQKQDVAHMIQKSDVICAGSDFFWHYGKLNRLSDYFSHPLFGSAQLLIATLPDGRNVFAARDFYFTIYRLNQLSIGNTMGAGDAFRGAFLAAWQEGRHSISYEAVLNGAKMAVAAATLKIENKCPMPQMPQMADIRLFAERLALRIKKDDSLT